MASSGFERQDKLSSQEIKEQFEENIIYH